MPPEKPHRSSDDDVEQQAAAWFTRCDRGLTPAEQDDYLQWMQEDARHPAAYARQEETLQRLEQLREWHPVQSTEPNPDLFAPARSRSWWKWMSLTLSVAAAIVIGLVFFGVQPKRPVRSPVAKAVLVVNEQKTLPDGSVVELREGSAISVQFTDAERRVYLTGKEALFTVAKNPARPFLVVADGVTVRAVGTAFAVRLNTAAIEVLVTEGKVSLGQSLATGTDSQSGVSSVAANGVPETASPMVVAGERATVSRVMAALAPLVTQVTAEEIKEELSWQKPRLQFYELPLVEALAEFNRHNKRQIVLGEVGLAAVPIGGSFRVDDIDGFVRLLEVTLGLRGEQGLDKVILSRAK